MIDGIEETARDIVRVCMTEDLCELRGDMVESIIQREVFKGTPAPLRAVFAARLAWLLSVALTELGDEVRRGGAL